MTDCLFCNIASGEMDANLIYQDDLVVAFDDIGPQAPHHKLIIPREHISTINDLEKQHETLVGHMMLVAQKLANELGIAEEGYRTVMNCNSGGGQAVYHIHLHLLGGRQMTWPPG